MSKNSTEGGITSMNDEKRNEINKAIKFGHSDEQIAELEGVSVEQVKKIRNEEESLHD